MRASAGSVSRSSQTSRIRLAVALGVLAVAVLGPIPCLAQQPDAEPQAGQVLTRGPVHEAFAAVVAFNPEPGVVVATAPPVDLTEIPPGERPAGENITWIPGYWAWDDERTDYLWVSGTWRALPPGREWVAGYWTDAAPGYQWTSGYWADVSAQETTYLPEPPDSVEAGPNVAAPAQEYLWTPGNWVWGGGSYAWGPGYWARGRADWDWIPAHYVWTRRGYIYVGGYWDYAPNRRGLLYAPVYFDRGGDWSGYAYTPSVVIGLGGIFDHLFLRPSYGHYYFGDYYASNYQQRGYYSSYSQDARRHSFDPVYNHQLWENRGNPDWQNQGLASFQYRRNHEAARPPHTWAAQREMATASPEFTRNRMAIGTTVDGLRKDRNNAIEFQPVVAAERTQLAKRGQDVNRYREQRQLAERRAAVPPSAESGGLPKPATVARERSPIAALAPDSLPSSRRPPAAQRSPKAMPVPAVESQPGSVTRQPKSENRGASIEPRRARPSPRSSQDDPPTRQPNAVPAQPEVQPPARQPRAVPAQPEVQPPARQPKAPPAQPQAKPETGKAAAGPADPKDPSESKKPRR